MTKMIQKDQEYQHIDQANFTADHRENGRHAKQDGEETRFASDDSPLLNWTMVANYLPEDYISEILTDFGPEIVTDSVELPSAQRLLFQEDVQDASADELKRILLYYLETMTAIEWLDFMRNLWQIDSEGKIHHLPLPSSFAESAAAKELTWISGGSVSTAAADLNQLVQDPELLDNLQLLHLERTQLTPGMLQSLVCSLEQLNTLSGKVLQDTGELLAEVEKPTGSSSDKENNLQDNALMLSSRDQTPNETADGSDYQAQKAAQAAAIRPWSIYFPFPRDTKLTVEYETILGNFKIGNAAVIKRSLDILSFNLHIDQWDLFNIPETDTLIKIQYGEEGGGNKVAVKLNGERFLDRNVTIQSRRYARDISMSIELLGQQIEKVTMTGTESDSAELRFYAVGVEHVLILTRI